MSVYDIETVSGNTDWKDTESGNHDRKYHTHKRKKRKKEKAASVRHVMHLLAYAARGDTAKIERFFRKHAHADVNSFNSEGHTALHQAARFGHTDTVDCLLRHGAHAKGEDFAGNTPAHLAAAKRHIPALTAILQAPGAPHLDAANNDGMSIRELMQAAIEERAATMQAEYSRDGTEMFLDGDAQDSEEEWQAKLQDNADGFGFGADWESFEYSSFQPGIFGDVHGEDEDAYARRMWEGMQKKKAVSKQQASAPATEAWTAADDAQQQRRRAAEDAAARSKRILEEEQARDQAWRQAVRQGDLGARRATYEAKWHVFAASKDPVTEAAVPWLLTDEDSARAVILHGTSGPADEKKRLRMELMRWHPDKFVARFGGRIAARDQQRIFERVKLISQMLNGLGNRA